MLIWVFSNCFSPDELYCHLDGFFCYSLTPKLPLNSNGYWLTMKSSAARKLLLFPQSHLNPQIEQLFITNMWIPNSLKLKVIILQVCKKDI